MSMIGNYFRTDEDTVRRLQSGELELDGLVYNEDDEVDEEHSLDIDKSWNALHEILSAGFGLERAVLGGEPVNGEDVGYGPALLVPADEAQKIADAIDRIGEAELRAHYDIDELRGQEVYPILEGEDPDEFFEYIWSYFIEIKAFYRAAAAARECVLFYLN